MSAAIGSRLPRGVVLEGTIRGHGDLRVAGEVLGPIEIEGHLTIEEGGIVRGELRARTITIAGTLEGNATALELIRLEPGARMTGDARAERVSAGQGALLKGRVRTSQERAQLERMRRTTGGTLLAPFSSSGGLLAPVLEQSSAGELDAPVLDRRTTDAVVERVTRDAVVDARGPATRETRESREPATSDPHAALVAAQSLDHAVIARRPDPRVERTRASEPASEPIAPPSVAHVVEESAPARAAEAPPEPERRAEMDRPPAPVMPSIGRRRAARRGAESAS